MKYLDQEQKLIIKILIVIVSIACIILLIINANIKNIKKGQFIIPEMEQNVVEGKPTDIPKEYMYQEAKVNDDYIVYLCAIPTFKDNKLTLYFTSSEVNKGLIKIKILDSQKNIIGESGLINPNSYIKDIELSKDLDDKEMITIKVMNYEKETYYSLGSIRLTVPVRRID